MRAEARGLLRAELRESIAKSKSAGEMLEERDAGALSLKHTHTDAGAGGVVMVRVGGARVPATYAEKQWRQLQAKMSNVSSVVKRQFSSRGREALEAAACEDAEARAPKVTWKRPGQMEYVDSVKKAVYQENFAAAAASTTPRPSPGPARLRAAAAASGGGGAGGGGQGARQAGSGKRACLHPPLRLKRARVRRVRAVVCGQTIQI